MTLVLEYLESHSEAADTFDGITQWWLGSAGVVIPSSALREALMRLVAAGVLRTRSLPGGETFWYAPGPRLVGQGGIH